MRGNRGFDDYTCLLRHFCLKVNVSPNYDDHDDDSNHDDCDDVAGDDVNATD